MFVPPTPAAVAATAERLGFRLDDNDAAAFRDLLVEQLAALDAFVQSRSEEPRPPLLFPTRSPGRRPSAGEDPLNVWLWKCDIGGLTEGLLAGRSVSFKDHIAVAGIPMTSGSFTMEGFVPDIDATVVTRSLAAGAKVVGKNALVGVGYLGDYWEAVNPHDAERMTGGSSSGSAAAVVAGEVDIAFGGDQHGSVRIPAAYCGAVGLKPTFGLISHMGATMAVASGSDPSIDHLGPIARTVRDVAVALQVVAGHDGYDPRQGREVPDSVDVLSDLDTGVEGLAVGILTEGFDEPIEAEVRDGVRSAVEALTRAGARVVEVSVPEHRTVLGASWALDAEGMRALRAAGPFGAGTRSYYPHGMTVAIDQVWRNQADALAAYTKSLLLLGEFAREEFHGAVYAKAHNVRPAFVSAYDAALEQVDVLAMPTCLGVAPPVFERLPFAEGWRRQVGVLRQGFDAMIRNTAPFNYTGHPAIAVPCGTVGRLPISLQLVGRRFDESTLLRVARAYEVLHG
ncbi:amidase [Actinomadura soli]|uniref:Amidase n=1 Tax=Actinomadura soli TaxID=2508997 RepID=A0A5C4JIB9_9ACTN|nr:amidase family protein [Actinomadura soli]TMR05698.1 amidase [Actinomadura soli]